MNTVKWFQNCNVTVTIKHQLFGGARGVMVIVVGNGHGHTSSNPRRE